jgi:hypothetical protein
MTQCERLAAEFEKGRELTMWEILHELRIGNHTGRISDLRARGYEIDDIGTKGFGVYKMRRKKCENVSVDTLNQTTLGIPGVSDGVAPEIASVKNTRFRMYKCKKGHRSPFYGDPEPKVKCDQCNFQEWAFPLDK